MQKVRIGMIIVGLIGTFLVGGWAGVIAVGIMLAVGFGIGYFIPEIVGFFDR